MKKILPLIFLFLSASAIAGETSLFTLRMTYGERVSDFSITQSGSSYFARVVSGTTDRRRKITRDDAQFIIGQLRHEKPRKEGPCDRRTLEARVHEGGKSHHFGACLGSGTELARTLGQIANLLASGI